jgi:hypothetical protein
VTQSLKVRGVKFPEGEKGEERARIKILFSLSLKGVDVFLTFLSPFGNEDDL